MEEAVKEYKKSYKGFAVWMIVFIMAFVVEIFLPIEDSRILLAISNNICSIGVFALALMIYCNERIYWYTGVSYSDAKKAGSAACKKYAMKHMKRFGYFAGIFLIYSIVAILADIPYGFDIAIFLVGICGVAISTMGIKLQS